MRQILLILTRPQTGPKCWHINTLSALKLWRKLTGISTLEPANNIGEYEVSSRTKEYLFFLISCFANTLSTTNSNLPPIRKKKKSGEYSTGPGKLELKYYTEHILTVIKG